MKLGENLGFDWTRFFNNEHSKRRVRRQYEIKRSRG